MLQVKDNQEVFDELVKPLLESITEGLDEQSSKTINELFYQSYVLGEIYGTISTCLARGLPIEEELWNHAAVKRMVRGDVDDVQRILGGVYQNTSDSPEVEIVKAFSPILLP